MIEARYKSSLVKNSIANGACSVAILFLTACTVGPDYVQPPVTITPTFKEAKGSAITQPNNKVAPVLSSKDWKIAQPQDDSNRGKWWIVFHDPYLDFLETQLNLYNQNIVNAAANYCKARAIVDEARASYFPTLSGTFNILREKLGGGSTAFTSTSGTATTVGTATTGTVRNSTTITTTYSILLDASWEPDIWGLVRRTVESDVAAAEASQALLALTRLSAQGALAQYYFELRTLDSDQQLLDNTVKDYKKALQLTKNQYASGVASQADILQAESLLKAAEAQAINNGILRGQYEHAIAVLMGRPPALFSIPFNPLLTTAPPVVPVMVPSNLLERRPDIAEAERLMQQANAQIGVAIAAYYPVLSLSASVSAAGKSFSKLFHTPSIGWSYGLQLAETIIDGGLRNATVRAAQATYMAQVASYRQTVLTAFQDVEDNLISLRILKDEGIVQNQAASIAKKALKLVINQYKAGTVAYSSVITAEISAFAAEKNAIDVVGLQMTSAVGLIKALGGGWSTKSLQ